MHWKDRIVERYDVDGPVAVVGDVHGALHLLDALLKEIGDMPLLHVGDLVDRGPDSKGVVQRMIDLGARGVRGNHEEWITQWCVGEGFDDMALFMGGATTLASYGVDPALGVEVIEAAHAVVPMAHRDYIASLPCVMDLRVDEQRYWLIHAGLPSLPSQPSLPSLPSRPRISRDDEVIDFARANRTALLWSKTSPMQMCRVDSTVIYGHVPDREPFDFGPFIRIDTGAGRNPDIGRLTAVILPERRFVTVGPS